MRAILAEAARRVAGRPSALVLLIDAIGLFTIAYGIGTIYRPAGIIAGGLSLLLLALIVDSDAPRDAAGRRLMT